MKWNITEQQLTNNYLVSSGLAAVDVIAIVQLASVQTLSLSLIIAACCFSIGIPLLAAVIILIAQVKDRSKFKVTFYFSFLWVGGVVLSLGGIAALFFHLHIVAGTMFIMFMVVSLVLSSKQYFKTGGDSHSHDDKAGGRTPPNNSFNRSGDSAAFSEH